MKPLEAILILCACSCHLQVGADVLLADADAYIERNAATSNFGTSNQLRLKNSSDNFKRKSYIRYDLSTLSFDHTTVDFSASLELTFFNTNAGNGGTSTDWTFRVYGLNDGDPGETWGETTITWNNAPQNDTNSGNAMLSGVTDLGSFTFTGRTADISFDGTNAVRNFVASSTANDVVTFVVVRDTLQPGSISYVHAMASKEHATEQETQLILTPIPEPSSILLVAVGALGMMLGRKRSS